MPHVPAGRAGRRLFLREAGLDARGRGYFARAASQVAGILSMHMAQAGGLATSWRGAAGLSARMALPLLIAACSLMPSELNLSPLYFHRLDEQGALLELDVLWPIVHYEQTPQGGDDFRLRPLYRRVTEPETKAVEHQFLWPFGRVRTDPEEQSQRLFPLWSWRRRINGEGERDVDWYLLFPFVWGGASADGREDYLAVFPFYVDIPQFISYDRFKSVLFPLYVRLDKEGHRHTFYLWPFFGTSSCAEANHDWFRLWPLYAHDIEPGRYQRHYLFWPFVGWGTENIDTENPVKTFWFWPFFGSRSGRDASGWTVFWPLFEQDQRRDHFYKLNLFWPFFHYYENRLEDHVVQWWLWPIYGQVKSDDQKGWSVLWPLIWWREYTDPDGKSDQQFILPFFWHVHRDYKHTGITHDFTKLWPLWHGTRETDRDGTPQTGNWSLLSPWPWREGNATGIEEAYGWLWEIARGVRRAPDDRAVDLAARLYTERVRHGRTQVSVPFLFNYEGDGGGGTLRLFQFLPIPFFGGGGGQ